MVVPSRGGKVGFTRFFHTDEDDPRVMTPEEVKAGVLAIKEVVDQHSDLFSIDHISDTEIVVNVRSDHPVETFAFDPEAVEGGFVLEFACCKTNGEMEDAGIKKMIDALLDAVHHKLVTFDDD